MNRINSRCKCDPYKSCFNFKLITKVNIGRMMMMMMMMIIFSSIVIVVIINIIVAIFVAGVVQDLR